MVETPLCVEVGETLPHWDAEQLTLQVTPRLEVSLMTVAVNEAVPPAGTLGEPAETATEITGGGPTTEAGPLQATIIAVDVKTKVVSRTVAERLMAPPRGTAHAPEGRLAPERRCTNIQKCARTSGRLFLFSMEASTNAKGPLSHYPQPAATEGKEEWGELCAGHFVLE